MSSFSNTLPAAQRNQESPVPLGLIGVGNIGRLQARVLSSQQWLGFTVLAAADPNQDNLDTLNGNIVKSTTFKTLLDMPDIRAVSICTPPSTHFQIAFDALAAGKHVFLEKPPALSQAECEQLIQFARGQECNLFMAYHTRYNPAVMAAQAELVGQSLRSISVEYKEDAHFYHDPNGWVFDRAVAGGGVLIDSGINVASVITALAPSTDLEVLEAQLSFQPRMSVETAAHVQFALGHNCVGTIDMDWLARGQEVRRILVEADAGIYELDIARGRLLKNDRPVSGDPGAGDAKVDQVTEYTFTYADFALHLARGQSNARCQELAFILKAYDMAERIFDVSP